MNQDPELASRRRRILLMVMASAFLVWQVPGMDFFERLAGAGGSTASSVAVAGFAVWAIALVALLASGKGFLWSASKQMRYVLEDELVKANRSTAFLIGYLVTLAAAVLMFAVSLYWPVSGTEAAHLIMVLGVVAPMYAFALLDRFNA